MRNAGKMRMSEELAVPVIIGKDTVYVNANIVSVATEDGRTEYEADVTEYRIEEWNALQNQQNAANLEYIAMMTEVDIDE